MSIQMSRRNLGAIGIISILIISGFTLLLLNRERTSPINIGEGASEFNEETKLYIGELTAQIEFFNENYFKGDNIPFELTVEVTGSPARLNEILVGVTDKNQSRSANQSINIDLLLQPGSHVVELELNPGFEMDGFIALTNKNYTLTSYELRYTQIQTKQNFTGQIGYNLIGSIYPVFDQAKKINWDIISSVNSSINISNDIISFISNEENATGVIQTQIETSAYTRFKVNVTGANTSSIKFGIDANITISNSTIGYLPLGNFAGNQTVSIYFNILNNENLTLSISIPTQKIALLTVVANNNWEKISVDSTKFRPSRYYLDQLNTQFSNVFNWTFVQVADVAFNSTSRTSLIIMREEAVAAVGIQLELSGNRWMTGVGTQDLNSGADILLVLTNKTMQNLGVVFRAPDGENSLNIAIAARGSENTGQESVELRLPSIYGDNLLQHELSHIFRAPDRWTEDDPSSVMTKSRPTDALLDIVTTQFWLMQTTWLEEDIQTMVEHIDVFL